MNFFQKICTISMIAAAIFTIAGCSSFQEIPSDLTLDELEQKMAQAMDPNGEYRRADSYFQRQNIIEEKLFRTDIQLVEVRFQRPDKLKLSYYEKNKIATEVLSNGDQAWLIDYRNGRIIPIEGEAFSKFRVMQELGHPDTDYDRLFAQVDLTLVQRDDERWYYKLVCHPDLPDANPIIIYVDKITKMPKLMEFKIKTPYGVVETVSDVVEFQRFGSLKLPSLTNIKEDSREYSTRIVWYQLNVSFEDDEFSLPRFDPVLMESKRQQELLSR